MASHRTSEIELLEEGQQEEEREPLVQQPHGEDQEVCSSSDSAAKVAYRTEIAWKRAQMLLLLLVPVSIMLIAWLAFDASSGLEANKAPKTISVAQYSQQLQASWAEGEGMQTNSPLAPVP
eukprot:TRINITY_DN27246_c0_g1_i1.p2 TRINITY_DN27246_c0_g1~~TRINITY_DN27246_c0_g1_i1.p2  ORF type:complete len:121 (-),score=21.70 TRINITY_DN27246_c0_g1_i1:982-1344(-)